MTKAKLKQKPVLKNGWKYIEDEPPPNFDDQYLVSNNPLAKDAQGNMSHVWISFIIESSHPKLDGRYVGFDGDERKIMDLIAWHPIPNAFFRKTKE